MEHPGTKSQRQKRSDADEDKIQFPSSNDYYSDEDDLDIECRLCNKEFPSVRALEQHLESKKHYKTLQAKKLMKKLGISDTSNAEANEDSANESPEEIQCEICSKSFSGAIPYNGHLKSHAHNKNVKEERLKKTMKDLPEILKQDENESDEDGILPKRFAECSTCQKVFYTPRALKQHLDGVNHKKKMQGIKTIEKLRKDVPEKSELEDDDEDLYSKCEICDKSFSGPQPYKIHLHSAVHQKQLKRVQKEEELKDFFTKDPDNQKLICKECSTAFTDPFSLKVHLDSNSHEKKKTKDEIFNFVSLHTELVAVKTIQNLSSDEENDENYRNGTYFFVCKLCHMSFSGPKSAQDHVKSKKHLQMKKEKEWKKDLQSKLQAKNKEVNLKVSNGSNNDPGSKNIISKTSPSSYTLSNNSKRLPSESNISDDFEFI